MEVAEHTPGPWDSSPQNGRPGYCLMAQVFGPDGKALATIEPTANCAEASANACVMSAGPDMLAALEGILADDAPQTSLVDQRARWCQRMDAARAAVAKARGAT